MKTSEDVTGSTHQADVSAAARKLQEIDRLLKDGHQQQEDLIEAIGNLDEQIVEARAAAIMGGDKRRTQERLDTLTHTLTEHQAQLQQMAMETRALERARTQAVALLKEAEEHLQADVRQQVKDQYRTLLHKQLQILAEAEANNAELSALDVRLAKMHLEVGRDKMLARLVRSGASWPALSNYASGQLVGLRTWREHALSLLDENQ